MALGAGNAPVLRPAGGAAPRTRHHVRAALQRPGFRRLLASRLAGQFGDGIFQASLAGAVLFNPERQAHAADVAAGFAVLLVPYSLVGPFAGVLLDRWPRRTTLALGNLARAGAVLLVAAAMAGGLHGVPFYACALVLISAARFLLAGLSASLPHLLPPRELVTGNALSTTAGTVVAAVGGGLALGVHAALPGEAAYAVIAAAAALPWLAAGAAAGRFGRVALGPTADERDRRETVADVARGLVAGLRHLRSRPQVAVALGAVATQRLLYGVASVCVVLLYRNYFTADGVFRSGLAGLSQAVAALALGGAGAALATPSAFRRIGPVRWPAAMFVGGAAVELGLILPYRLPLALAGVLALGFVAQSVKICVDTLVQQQVVDDFRGRVFAVYDALFNVMLVIAALLTATVLPDDGHAPVAVLTLAGGYLALSAGYAVAADAARRATAAVG